MNDIHTPEMSNTMYILVEKNHRLAWSIRENVDVWLAD